MARSFYIPNKHLVLATERAPAGFRYDNQARLVNAKATNPIYAHTDAGAFLPGMGECRSGNGHSDLGLGNKWLARGQVTVNGVGSLGAPSAAALNAARAAMMAQQNAASVAAANAKAELAAAQEAATVYQDANGNNISKAEYNRLMSAPPPRPAQAEAIYKDATGAVITKTQYEALVRAEAQQKSLANLPAAQALYKRALTQMRADQALPAVQRVFPGLTLEQLAPPAPKPPAPPKVIVKKLPPRKPLNGLGFDIMSFGGVSPKNLLVGGSILAAFLLYKTLKKSR